MAARAPKQADFLRALRASPPADVEALYWRARVTLTGSAADFAAFDAVFDAFFRGGRLVLSEPGAPPPEAEGETAAPRGGDEGELRRARAARGLRPAREPARHREHAHVRAHRRRRARARCARSARRSRPRCPRSRARAAARACDADAALDLQRVLRGGQPHRRRGTASWPGAGARRARGACCCWSTCRARCARTAPTCCASRHEVVRGTERAEAFTFGTRLTRVTGALDTPDVDSALAALSATVLDADGGTRIGVALQQFLADTPLYRARPRRLIIVISDGLERGDPAAMAEATRRPGPARPPAGVVVAAGLRSRLPAGDARDERGAGRAGLAQRSARPADAAAQSCAPFPAVEARPRRTAGREWAAA